MPDRPQLVGRLAGTTQILFAVLIGVVASFGYEPGFVSRGAVLMAIFALPGFVGLIGVRARRPGLLVAAWLTSAVGAFIAFSGVTLIFLVPSLMFLVAAAGLSTGSTVLPRAGWRSAIAQLALAAAIVPLVVGAGASTLLVTDAACWSSYETPLGVRVETLPYTTGEIEVPSGAISTGCSTGLMSPRGVGLGSLLALGAIGLALLAARRRVAAAVT